METAWKSERLVYRALKNNEKDRKYMHEILNSDPIISGND
jgi:hypothetical protein